VHKAGLVLAFAVVGCVNGLIAFSGTLSDTVQHMPAAFGPVFSGLDGVSGPLQEPPIKDKHLCKNVTNESNRLLYNGSIVFVPRGGCQFGVKITNAMMQGAKGVVVYNEEQRRMSYDAVVRMSAENLPDADSINIPSVFISFRSYLILDDLRGVAGNATVTLIINGTGEYNPHAYNPSPLFLKSLLFMLEMLVVIWTFVALIFAVNWYKLRLVRQRRLGIVKKLPTRVYRVGRANSESSADGRLDTDDAAAISPGSCDHEDIDLQADHHRVPTMDSSEGEIELGVIRKDGPVSSDDTFERPITDYFDSENCVICLGDFEDGETLTVLPCGHGYHQECIEPWLISKSALCPVCKQSILPSGDARSLDEISASDGSGESEEGNRVVYLVVGGFVVIILMIAALHAMNLA